MMLRSWFSSEPLKFEGDIRVVDLVVKSPDGFYDATPW